MRAEIPFGQREFFLKSSRPSFLIKRAALGNLKASFHCIHWHRFFPLKKEIFRKPTRPYLPLKKEIFRIPPSPFSQREVFLKSSRPSLPLKKAPPLISVFFNGLYTPFGSPVSGGQKPQARRRKLPYSVLRTATL